MERKHKEFDVSALVLTYYPDYSKLFDTVNSILCQKNVSIQIVISDDGTKDFKYDQLKKFFEEKQNCEYEIVRSSKNCGTVANVANGLKKCTGKYTKLISPGDLLYGFYTLRNWIDLMEEKKLICSFSSYKAYKGELTNLISFPIFPIIFKDSYTEQGRIQYLLYDDLCLGAAVLCDTETLIKYIYMIEKTVMYAEDNAYRLMIACGEKIEVFNEQFILYEVGSGISTSKNRKWSYKLNRDWNETNKIINSVLIGTKKLKMQYKIVSGLHLLKNTSLGSKIGTFIKLLVIPGYRKFYKTKKKKCFTNTEIDASFINTIQNMRKDIL